MSTTDHVPEKITGLTRMQAKLYDHLRQHGPVPAKQLAEPVLGRAFRGDFSAISCHVYRLRPILKAHGVTIARTRRDGYRLAPAPEATN